MDRNDPRGSAEQAWKTASIILVSLPLGVTLFAAVVLLVIRPPPADVSSLELVLAVYTPLIVGVATFLWHRRVRPHLPATRGRTSPEQPAPYALIQTGTIICMALIEGAALFGVVVTLIGGDPMIAVASMVLVWAAWFVMRPRREWYGLR